LAGIGYAPGDITYLALSHFHWDHVGNANQFAGATWLVRKLERDTMFAEPPSPRTEPANFSALKNSKTVIITDRDYDVFGDGTVVIKSAAGHSPDDRRGHPVERVAGHLHHRLPNPWEGHQAVRQVDRGSAQAERVDQDELAHALRLGQGQLEGDAPAQRRAHHGSLAKAATIHVPLDESREIRNPVTRSRFLAAPKTG